ncbi:dynein regulatory complex protein 9-like isoform X1 [Embiotoca jacksoni]|uniref:dynein regulatory complex protein 9-like isoform X1 n=1 Tax=Embiotoca jacksoni TaxID=100190 RepID=UPI0037042147
MSLSRSQSLRTAAVVEDCSLQLDMLGHSLHVKASRPRGTLAAQERRRLTVLRRECQRMSELMSEMHLELQEKQTFSCLQPVVEEEEQKKKEEEMKRELEDELGRRGQALKRQKDELQHMCEELRERTSLCSHLKSELMRQKSKLDGKKTAEQSSTEQKVQQTQRETCQAETLLRDELKRLETQLKEEMRSHEFVMKFLQEEQQELQQKKQQLQRRSEQMLQEKKKQLEDVCRKRTSNLDRLTEMRTKFQEMEQVVLEDREEQEKERLLQAEARAATKLQAWWRGCTVRRGLGSFKEAHGHKKRQKAAKKKKK